jgi:MOSC domain-containing protein YiiM
MFRDALVCIDGRYRVGVAFCEVTQPRVTCYRLGFRISERPAWLLICDEISRAA